MNCGEAVCAAGVRRPCEHYIRHRGVHPHGRNLMPQIRLTQRSKKSGSERNAVSPSPPHVSPSDRAGLGLATSFVFVVGMSEGARVSAVKGDLRFPIRYVQSSASTMGIIVRKIATFLRVELLARFFGCLGVETHCDRIAAQGANPLTT